MNFTARILAKEIVSTGPNDSVAAAAVKMAQAKVGAVVVLDAQGRLSGIFTERDMTYRVAAKGLDAARTKVADVMTTAPATLQADDPLEKVFQALNQNAHRHLPVLDGQEIIGMVSLHDFAKLLDGLIGDQALVKRFAETALSSPRQVFRLKKRS